MNFSFLNSTMLKILGILIGALVLRIFLVNFAHRLFRRAFYVVQKVGLSEQKRAQKRIKTLVNTIANVVTVIVGLIVFMMILSELGLDIGPLVASAGIMGLGIGFGAQTLVKDFITGLFILAEDQMGEGDIVEINNILGKVEKITLRTVVLRDQDGAIHIIPNNRIGQVANLTRDWARVNLELSFSNEHDFSKVEKVLQKAGKKLKEESSAKNFVLGKFEVKGPEELMAGKYKVRVLQKTHALRQWETARVLRLLIMKELKKERIELA